MVRATERMLIASRQGHTTLLAPLLLLNKDQQNHIAHLQMGPVHTTQQPLQHPDNTAQQSILVQSKSRTACATALRMLTCMQYWSIHKPAAIYKHSTREQRKLKADN